MRWLAALGVSLCALSARADVYGELSGPRSSAMGGAHRGLGTSNDTLVLNPAGMAMARRYSIDLVYGFSPYDSLSRLQLSVVDSKSGPVAGGVGYTYTFGNPSGADPSLHRIYAAAAYRLFDAVGIGVNFEHVNGTFKDQDGEHDVALYTGDLGLLLALGTVSLGVVYQNLVRTELVRLTPPMIGVGAAINLNVATLAADVAIDMRHRDDKGIGFQLGGEYLLGGGFPIRLGYRLEPFERRTGERTNEHFVTAGIGYLVTTGGLELAYNQSVTRRNNWGFVFAFKVFF